MKPITSILEERISAAMAQVTCQQRCLAIVSPATDPKFGDYQANGVMALAKKLKVNPRKLAEEVISKLITEPRTPNTELLLSDICEPPEVAGPGFINLRLKADFVTDSLLQISKDLVNLGIEKTTEPKTIVVDFSGPNIAKEMHVGHLRSTIIGDCICRTLEFLGHTVIRQNHIGDWGTALGKVILGLWHMCMDEKKHEKKLYYINELKELNTYAENKEKLKVICQRIYERHEKDWEEDSDKSRGDGERYFKPFLSDIKRRDKSELWNKITILYQYVNLLEDSVSDMGFKVTTRKKINGLWTYPQILYELLSRHITSMLQKLDDKDNEQEKKAWKLIRKISIKYCQEIYKRLNVNLKLKDIRGESYYRKRNRLILVVEDLRKAGIAVESDGAICVFPEGFRTKEGKAMPFIIRKSDEAHLYATTDLAALRFRVTKLNAQKIIYVTDARQQQHFNMLFKVAEMAGWANRDMLHHIPFGSVLGEDGKPLKTRSGENVELKELLDEAEKRAKAVVEEKNPELDPKEKKKITNAVGIGAVKYADYSNNRTSDYVFSFDKMLAMEGNTAPYMQYAYARIKSIERKAQDRGIDYKGEIANLIQGSAFSVQRSEIIETCPLSAVRCPLSTSAELDLAKHLIRYGEAIEAAIADYRPNYLTAYLYELAQKFSVFYTNCPVLDASPDKRPTRLLLCDLTANTIRHGLSELLGIDVVEQM
ncbi:MAG: arginine--tRNA ligase [Sedimentisphaerales bacterium]|nr:arginine--tRNA ligase [Sedimentisphaerales bacterium]